MSCLSRNFLFTFLALGLILLPGFVLAKIELDSDQDGLNDYEEQAVYKTNVNKTDTDVDSYQDGEEVYHGYSPLQGNRAELTQVSLAVPYISEAPDNNWTGPWKNACEEASIAMADYYYRGSRSVAKDVAKNYMWDLFTKQNQLYNSNADADSVRTLKLIADYSSFQGKIIDKPTIAEIKKELQQKRLVISLHYGFDLKNKNIPFLATGSSYHMMVIVGYDDTTKEFITNDPGDMKAGLNHRYDYDLFMKTLHDFDFNQAKANGPARVIFTYPRLARTATDWRIYYLDITNKIKRYVSDPRIFKANNWSWDIVMVVDKLWLDEFTVGSDYNTAASSQSTAATIIATSGRYIFSRYLYLGNSGEEVRQLQMKLKSLSYYTHSEITGYYGPLTQAAVIKFQQAKGLSPYPGWVGPGTMEALNKS